MIKHNIVVIGASAGGLPVLSAIVSGLPKDLQAAIFIVWHISPNHHSILPDILSRVGELPASHPVDGEAIAPSKIYIAPPDYHLLIEEDHVRLTKVPKENRFRPAIDTLFRSAAYVFGPSVIGVVLTGMLDDGTAGLWSIKDRKGIAIVQDPNEAQHPSMPHSAMQHVDVDYCLPSSQIAQTLVQLIKETNGENGGHPMSDQLEIETKIALKNNSLQAGVLKLGEPSLITCPECNGTLLQIRNGNLLRYRCHTGHAFSTQSLLADVIETTENSLWSSLRALEENIILLNQMVESANQANQKELEKALKRKAEDIQKQITLVRQAVMLKGELFID